LVAGGQEAFRLLMVEHFAKRKATSEEFDPLPVVVDSPLTRE
jgi:hypothetical protein